MALPGVTTQCEWHMHECVHHLGRLGTATSHVELQENRHVLSSFMVLIMFAHTYVRQRWVVACHNNICVLSRYLDKLWPTFILWQYCSYNLQVNKAQCIVCPSGVAILRSGSYSHWLFIYKPNINKHNIRYRIRHVFEHVKGDPTLILDLYHPELLAFFIHLRPETFSLGS